MVPPGPRRCGPDWPPFPTMPPSSWSTTPPAPWPPARCSPRWSTRCASGGADGAIPVLPVADTLKRVAGGPVVVHASTGTGWSPSRRPRPSPPPRCEPPTGRRRGHRRRRAARGAGRHRAHRARGPPQREAHPARGPVAGRGADGDGGRPVSAGSDGRRPPPVGQGIDVHRFSDDPDRPLVLGGVVITGEGRGASRGTATPTPWPMPLPTPCSGRPGSATSAATPRTPTRRGRGPTAWSSWPAWSAWPARPAGPRSTPTARWWPSGPGWPRSSGMAERLTAVLGAPVNVKATRAEGLGALGPGRRDRLHGRGAHDRRRPRGGRSGGGR